MGKHCEHKRPDGTQCRGWAKKNNTLCFAHDPNSVRPTGNKKKGVKYKVEPTNRQEKLAEIIVKDKTAGLNTPKAELVKQAGYGKSAQLSPNKVVNTPGVQSALAKYGLTLDIAVERHKKILRNAGDQTALNAVKLAYEVEGIIGNKSNQTATFVQILNQINPQEDNQENSSGFIDQLQS